MNWRTKLKQKNRSVSKNQIVKTIVNDIDLSVVKPQRAGVILYTVHNNSVYFGLGVDCLSHDLTDFGGNVHKNKENVIEGALREFEEETLGIFKKITINDIKQYPVVYDSKNLIIFIHVSVDPNKVSEVFNNKFKNVLKTSILMPEVCGITWLSWKDFYYSINNKGVLFFRVQKFLSKSNDFSYLL
jgi:hypothetical protein